MGGRAQVQVACLAQWAVVILGVILVARCRTSRGGGMPNIKEVMKAGRDDEIELNINAEPVDYLLLFVTGYLVIIAALIVPAANIMRYQPKEILAGKE